ncbi:MAG: hypothetical protein NXI01_07630 [Gammaproteobacteria bacterium]|nr:hypothetical protein [Gammaproteobacteria bacterium]
MQQQLMKTFFWGLLFLSSIVMAKEFGVYETHPYEFLIKKNIFQFSETYLISAPSQSDTSYQPTYRGMVKKSAFRIRTNYDLSNQNGWQATGITRLLSMGIVYPWATDIDIYDTRGVKIGFIDGSIATLESARFDLYHYDETGHSTQVGVALANADFTHFSITNPENYLSIAELTRDMKKNAWKITVTVPEIIDDRMIRIFAGFVINYQDQFLATPVDRSKV